MRRLTGLLAMVLMTGSLPGSWRGNALSIADAAATGDKGLSAEAELWVKLVTLMESGAEQGSLYDMYE